jgi:hypothetical protein
MSLTGDGGLAGTYTGEATGGGACCGTLNGTVALVRK